VKIRFLSDVNPEIKMIPSSVLDALGTSGGMTVVNLIDYVLKMKRNTF
jgi:hypothetical protein